MRTSFLDPATDGAVLPILHLNGWRSRIRLCSRASATTSSPTSCAGTATARSSSPATIGARASGARPALDEAYADIRRFQLAAREHGVGRAAAWPAIVLRTPKGWTAQGRGRQAGRGHLARRIRCRWRETRENPSTWPRSSAWLQSYRPEELFGRRWSACRGIRALAPLGAKAHGSSPHANAASCCATSICPTFRDFAVTVRSPADDQRATRVLGTYLLEVMRRSAGRATSAWSVPTRPSRNRLGAVLEETGRAVMGERSPLDEGLSPDGRVMEILSEHLCQGWLEGTC